MEGIGKPEPLKYRDGYSRMLDEQNRVFYDAVDENVSAKYKKLVDINVFL